MKTHKWVRQLVKWQTMAPRVYQWDRDIANAVVWFCGSVQWKDEGNCAVLLGDHVGG